ncbi:hypothetical protein Tco_0727114 [Tanacetum coccineum]|uniref:Uncharacterized protein n=1 Tax=Tanacetum coccineum TaxID=301880 RepID=A0ABQ4YHI1_9ASTR
MSQRGKRGIALCAKTYPATSYTITFNDIGLSDSDMAQRFATWMGVEVRARVSYLKGWKQVTTQELDQLWLRAKELWNISDDSATEHKKVLPRKMNEYHRKFKTNLTHIAQEGKDPLLVYKDLNMEDWPEFVSIRNSPAFMEKSAKAKANALKNTDRHKMGQTSYVRLEKMLAPIMQDSERRYPEIAKLECRRSKLHIFGRCSTIPAH